jgi:hypothetical protein
LRDSKKERLAQEDGTVTEQVITDDVESDEGACRAGGAVAVSCHSAALTAAPLAVVVTTPAAASSGSVPET